MRCFKYILQWIVFATIVSCDKSSPDCFKKAGSESSLTREMTPFSNVTLESNVDVVLRHGNSYKVEVVGPKNLLDKVETSVNSNTLTVDNRNTCNFVRGYKHYLKVIVTCPKYHMVTTNSIGKIITEADFIEDSLFVYTEGGDITIDGKFDQLRTGSHGGGNVYFKGTANELLVYMNGINFFYGQDGSVTNYVFVENISLGDAFVNAPSGGILSYHMWKTGNLFFKGDPAVVEGKSERSGSAIKQ